MSAHDYLHEVEIITMRAPNSLECKSLRDFMKSLSFCIEDDFFYLDRESKASPWQSITIMSVDVYLDDYKVDPNEDSYWNRLEVSYLLASLPKHYISVFSKHLSAVNSFFKLSMFYKNEGIDRLAIEETFFSFAEQLTESYGEPGSEILAILIQDIYPR